MHGEIGKDDKRASKHSQTNAVLPQSCGVEAERAEDSRARDFNVEAVFVVDEGEVFDFVDDEAFEGVVEDGQLRV